MHAVKKVSNLTYGGYKDFETRVNIATDMHTWFP